MNRRFPRLSADDLNRVVRALPFAPRYERPVDSSIVLQPKTFHAGHPVKALGGPRYLCRECGETLGVCSCFRPVRLEP